MTAVDRDLLDILACPRCRGPVEPDPDRDALLCRPCRLRFRVEDGIPVMLVEEAEGLED